MCIAPGPQTGGWGLAGLRSAKHVAVPVCPSIRGWTSHVNHFHPFIHFDAGNAVADSDDAGHERQPRSRFHGSQTVADAPPPVPELTSAAAIAAATNGGIGSSVGFASMAPS